MATNPFDTPYTGASLFDIYNDAVPVPRNNAPRLPSGACNFVDLGPGANGARCGCRRFWTRSAVGSPTVDGAGWCMCNHHACFHDHGDQEEASPDGRTHGQENERPKTGREPLSPMMALYSRSPTPIPGQPMPSFVKDDGLSFLNWSPGPAFDEAIPAPAPATQPHGSLPDTLPWDPSYQTHPNTDRLPPYSQGLVSQTASTTSSVQARYMRPFGGKGLNTLASAKPQAPSPLRTGQLLRPQDREADSFVLVSQDRTSLGQQSATQQEPRVMTMENAVTRESFKNLTDTVSGHEQRLDRLETVSFSAPGHEDCHEKHDHIDLRVTDLETRIEEVEKLGKTDRNDEVATQSIASFSTSGTGRVIHSQELVSQIQSLQAQVATLQSAIPAYNHAWEVEVVFLPFPLKRVWQGINNFKLEPNMGSDDWTQLPMTYSTTTLRSQSPFMGDWASPDHDAEWLMPRACGDKSVTDKRLRSRGLVKTVSVTGPDARSVQLAMHAAFGSVLREMGLEARPQPQHQPDPRLSRFLGLQSSWVPLRKIHKDSRLRFLSPGEMLSPAMWDIQFLNSIMMRSSEPRLFVTHPNAYLQDMQAYETGWTWQKLREMPRVYPDVPDVTESQAIPEGDALEECWAWAENLDESPHANTSMNLRQQRFRSASPHPQITTTTSKAWRSSSPTIAAGHQPPILKGRRGSRPPHIRTDSISSALPVAYSPAVGRHRVSSNGQSRRSSPAPKNISQYAVIKRRRTRSPSHARFTPRWTASPSPMPMGAGERHTVRGTTPFAYATPYSNDPGPLQDVRSLREGSAAPMMYEYHSKDDDEMNDSYYEDVEVYESTSEEGQEDRTSIRDVQNVTHVQPHPARGPHHAQLPEDEPWPGIEDQEQLSDGENIDPSSLPTDQQSNASSQPSEYPSTQRRWPNVEAGFSIHEDN
ncbi:hypothetical protein N3K66_004683 [Trichothecium roseum]|uniref:Uncharacterized protein n=1 Tax=Trichothecium roseum TaxID=47278 RepID=A0ACC0V3S6_9HYPO|nr:hypothetical protein N3K66_004683 [Trichothecium roseum]